MNVDGAPTLFCFHASCSAAVAEANRRLRRELGAWPWELRLPGGRVLRSGDILQSNGEVKLRESAAWGQAAYNGQNAAWGHAAYNGQSAAWGHAAYNQEKLVLASLQVAAERFKPELFEFFHWPMADMFEDSPMRISDCEPDEQFRAWLKIWPADSTVWIGDVFSSGKPEHRTHFRPVAEWDQIGPVMGNFTCGSSFVPGSFRRSNDNLTGHRFMVVESDVLSRNEVGAVFRYLTKRLRYRLHCIIDTGGKSLHGWFDVPRDKIRENRLKAGLTAFGCDPKLFTYSQPVRLPGAYREDRLQRLVWLRAANGVNSMNLPPACVGKGGL